MVGDAMSDEVEVYVSTAGIRVCENGWDKFFYWDRETMELERCMGHITT
jgi:hypothetical protein